MIIIAILVVAMLIAICRSSVAVYVGRSEPGRTDGVGDESSSFRDAQRLRGTAPDLTMTWLYGARAFWLPLSLVFLLDCATKQIVSTYFGTVTRLFWNSLSLGVVPYFYNRGAGLSPDYLLGGCAAVTVSIVWAWYRWPNRWTWIIAGALVLFACSAIAEWSHLHQWSWARPSMAGRLIAIVMFAWEWYRQVGHKNRTAAAALGLIAGGASGNLWDLLRWDGGVPDFLFLRLGIIHMGIFNVADLGILCGGLWLIWQLGSRPALQKGLDHRPDKLLVR